MIYSSSCTYHKLSSVGASASAGQDQSSPTHLTMSYSSLDCGYLSGRVACDAGALINALLTEWLNRNRRKFTSCPAEVQ